jgi:hypothetical protein
LKRSNANLIYRATRSFQDVGDLSSVSCVAIILRVEAIVSLLDIRFGTVEPVRILPHLCRKEYGMSLQLKVPRHLSVQKSETAPEHKARHDH